jgi:predicted transcriptional regulator
VRLLKSALKERVVKLLSQYQGSYIPQSHIHKAVGGSKSSVSEILAELEREGLIARVVVGRNKLVYVYPGLQERVVEQAQRALKLGIVYSSEYLFLGGFVKALERRGWRVDVVVFREGLKATKAVAEGLVDMALSPLPSQLYLYPLYRSYIVVPAGLKGGFRVVELGGGGPVYSSIISTMDYARHVALSKRLVEADRTVYYRDPDEVKPGRVKSGYVVAWHPLYIELERAGYKPILTPEDLEVDFCCTLALSKKIGERAIDTVVEAYMASLRAYKRDPDRWIEYYSLVTGIDTSTLRSATREYSLAESIGEKAIDKLTSSFAPLVPARQTYSEAILSLQN